MARDGDERRNHLIREEPLQIALDAGKGHRLVHVHDVGERHQIRDRRMARVQHPQLVQLPVVHTVGEDDARVLPARSTGGKSVLDHPLPKRLADDRPGVVNADLVAQPLPVTVLGLRCDAIDHRVRERARLDVAHQLRSVAFSHGDDRRAGCVTVAGQVVAAQDRQRPAGACPPGLEPGDDRLDGQIAGHEGVAALGDRQGKNRHLGIGDALCECAAVTGRERVVDDAADDPRPRAFAVTLDQRVEVVLRPKNVGHSAIGVE